ncbi:uncharacterized protein ACBT44_010468 [Syngnathus typhle]
MRASWFRAQDEAIAPESSTQNPLVSVTFQRDPNRKQKYLEAEPKALGLRAGLGMQILSTVASFFNVIWILIHQDTDWH